MAVELPPVGHPSRDPGISSGAPGTRDTSHGEEISISEQPKQPVNAFSSRYLSALREKDEPPSALDAEFIGPWRFRERAGYFHIFWEWESFEAGHLPVADFLLREDALLFMTALRAVSELPVFRARKSSDPASDGYEIEREGELAGHLRSHPTEVLTAVNTLAVAARSPMDLAVLFEMSGSQVQEMAGEILGQEVMGEPGTDPDDSSGA